MSSDGFAAVRRSLAVQMSQLRERAEWTQQEAADAIGIDVKHLQKLEYGALNPSLRTLVRVAAAFRVPIGRLLETTARAPKRRPVGRPRENALMAAEPRPTFGPRGRPPRQR